MTVEESKNLEENLKRHFDVAVEEFKSEFKVFGEKLTDVDKKVDSLGTKVDSIETKVDLLVEDMDYVKSEVVEIRDLTKA